MHVVVGRKDLLRVLARCQGVANRKSTMPVLGNVLLEVEGPDRVKLAATDLYLAVSGSVPAKVDKGGSVAVGARDLFERVRMMPEGEIEIATGEGAGTTVQAVGSPRRYTLHGIPGEEFPSLPAPESGAVVQTLPAHVLAGLIGGTHFSISTDETRVHLNSALFEWERGRVRMVTTDGHRLSKMEVETPGSEASGSILVPLKGVLELKRLCEEVLADVAKGDSEEAQGGTVRMVQSGPNAFFQLGTLQFSVKLVDAQFPPYEQVIPASSEHTVQAPRVAMADALRAVSIAANDRTGGVKLTLGSNVMRFESESPESGEGFDEVPVDYTGPEFMIGFNARYFLDVLGAMCEDEVVLGVSGELDPAVLTPAGESSTSNYVAVVMPMRI
jgi:DNA polymerase-3 subunit beta